MHVLIVRNSYAYNYGGAERLAVSIALELERNGIQPIIVSRQKRLLSFAAKQNIQTVRGLWWTQQNWSGVRILLLPIFLFWQIVLAIWYLVLILRYKPTALHLMSRDDFIAGTVVGRALGKRVIWTDCADLKYVYLNHSIWYKNPVGKLVYLCGKIAHSVTVVSKNEKKLIEQSIGHSLSDNYGVMYLVCADTNVSSSAIKRRDDEIVICSTSRLVIDKGIGDLIEAFSEISVLAPHAKLWLVGDGPDEDIFKNQARSRPNIKFYGYQGNPLEYLAAADIYVHASHHEGFSVALAEAAMLAKPVVATDVGGNPELLAFGGGLLVEPHNADAIAHALAKLVESTSLRDRMGGRARKSFVQHFNLTTVVSRQLVPLYTRSGHAHTD